MIDLSNGDKPGMVNGRPRASWIQEEAERWGGVRLKNGVNRARCSEKVRPEIWRCENLIGGTASAGDQAPRRRFQ